MKRMKNYSPLTDTKKQFLALCPARQAYVLLGVLLLLSMLLPSVLAQFISLILGMFFLVAGFTGSLGLDDLIALAPWSGKKPEKK